MLKLRNFVVLAVVALIGVVLSGEMKLVVGQESCEGDLVDIITQCAAYVQKGSPTTDPSKGCCDVIKKVDIHCACNHVTKEVEEVVDMNKVLHVVSYCGITLPKGTKCGSKNPNLEKLITT
ncbi:hypothetical protein ACFX1X_028794 [Malus domestica]